MKSMFALLFLLPLATAFAAEPSPVPYPEGYRNWYHVKSMVIQAGHPLHDAFGGIHHLYANPQAVQGYKTGAFPDGAVIVLDLLDAKSADSAIVEGDRKIVGVMHKNNRLYKTTGGWGFEEFKGTSKSERSVGRNAASACFQCHTQRQNREFVFSNVRE